MSEANRNDPPPERQANKLTRDNVYALIDLEREHQIRKWGHVQQSVQAYVLVMLSEVAEVVQAWARTGDEQAVLDELRQVCAVCVAALERHGCPSREVK